MNFTELVRLALTKAGKQDSLAITLDLSPSALSKRINNEVGWGEKEINTLLDFTQSEVVSVDQYKKKLLTLKEAMKILLDGEKEE